MTISTEIRKAGPYLGDGVTTAFPFAFKIFEASDTYVVRTSTLGVATVLTIGSTYTAVLNPDQNTSPGGNVVLTTPLAIGETLWMTSDIPYVQPRDLNNAGGLYPTVVTDGLDWLTALIQQLRELISDNASYNLPGAQGPAGPAGPAGPQGPPGNDNPLDSLIVAASDETTALTAGVGKVTFRWPYAVTLSEVRAMLNVAQGSGSVFTVDINEGGSSILSTKLTIDNTEKTSETATIPAVISDLNIADDAEMSIDIDQIGNGTAKGLKVAFIFRRS